MRFNISSSLASVKGLEAVLVLFELEASVGFEVGADCDAIFLDGDFLEDDLCVYGLFLGSVWECEQGV
jgi:hypothetical protein